MTLSDFASEVAKTMLSSAQKSMLEIERFFKFLFDRYDKNLRSNTNDNKETVLQKKGISQIEGVYGRVKGKILADNPSPVVSLALRLTTKELAMFNERCKREGVSFSAIRGKYGEDGKAQNVIIIPESKLGTVKRITARITTAIKIEAINKKIEVIQGQKKLTEQDKLDIKTLQNERFNLWHNETTQLNNEQNSAIIDEICSEGKSIPLSFDETMNHYTDRDFSGDSACVICERTKPENYIECTSTTDYFHKKPYTKTDYVVFADDKKVLNVNDGRYEGRIKGHWDTIKSQMQKAGKFSDDLLVFDSAKDYQKYKSLFRVQTRVRENFEQKNELGRNYGALISQLQEQLNEKGAVLNKDNAVIHKVTGKPIELGSNMSQMEKCLVAEAVCIGKQVQNYNTLGKLEVQLAMLKAETENMSISSPEYETTVAKLKDMEMTYSSELGKETELQLSKNRIYGVIAEQGVNTGREGQKLSGLEHADERRTEHITEISNKAQTMSEYKGQINERRQQISHENSVADRQFLNTTRIDIPKGRNTD